MPLEDLRTLKLDLSRLLDSRGWQAFCSILQGQIRARRAALVETRLGRLDDCFELVRMQGELAGLQAIKGLPEAIIEELKFEIERREQDVGRD